MAKMPQATETPVAEPVTGTTPEISSDVSPSGTPASAETKSLPVDRAEALLDRLMRVGRASEVRPKSLEMESSAPVAAQETGDEPSPSVDSAVSSPVVERADLLLAEAGERIGAFAAIWGKHIRKTAALAWEGLEDIYADADSLRQGDAQGATTTKAASTALDSTVAVTTPGATH